MNLRPGYQRSSISHQRGVGTLLIAIILLSIVTIFVLFSLTFGVFDQRVSTNEYRFKMTQQVAQAGLDHGLELLKAKAGDVISTWLWGSTIAPVQTERWEQCSATDMTVPCGAIQPGVASSSTRATYLYYHDTNSRISGADPLTLNFAALYSGTPTGQLVTSVGNFSADYEVYALLCLVNPATAGTCLPRSSITGTRQGLPYAGNAAITLISKSRLAAAGASTDAENAQAVLKETTASYRILAVPPDVPLVASNQVTGLGNGDIVTNPNGGGPGIPLSIWSAGNIHVDNNSGGSNASFATCFPDEFFKTGTPSIYEGSMVCPGSGGGACSCSAIANMVGNSKSPYGLGVISGHFGTNAVAGPDLLGVGVNGILPDTHFFPLSPLNIFSPADKTDDTPFEYLFGANVADSNSVILDADSNGIDDATDWLVSHQFQDITSQGCGSLSANSQGFIWYHGTGGCSLPNGDVGTPGLPVTLVVQSDIKFSAQTRFFGIAFVRSPAGIGQSVVSSGSYNVQMTGGAQLYGAMIIEGTVAVTGSPQIIYDANTLQNVVNSAPNNRMGVLPGSWSDAGRIDASGKYAEN